MGSGELSKPLVIPSIWNSKYLLEGIDGGTLFQVFYVKLYEEEANRVLGFVKY